MLSLNNNFKCIGVSDTVGNYHTMVIFDCHCSLRYVGGLWPPVE
jgi:hypothetical protein